MTEVKVGKVGKEREKERVITFILGVCIYNKQGDDHEHEIVRKEKSFFHK